MSTMARRIVADRYRESTATEKDIPGDLASSAASPVEIMEREDIASQIGRALGALAHSHRLAFELSQLGLSAKQMAVLTGCTEKAAQRRLEKSREELRYSLSACGNVCAIDSRRLDQCPARMKDSYCLKWLYVLHLRAHA